MCATGMRSLPLVRSGHQNLCDLGALILVGVQADGTYRRRVRYDDMLAGRNIRGVVIHDH